MLLYALKRLIYVVPVALGVSLVCFMLVHLAPGDPLTAVLPVDAIGRDCRQEMRTLYGFDKPLPVQYGRWLAASLHGRPRHLDRHRPAGGDRGASARSRTRSSWPLAATLIGFALRHAPRHRRPAMPSRASSTGWHPWSRCSASACRITGWHGAGHHLLRRARRLPPTGGGPGRLGRLVASTGRICATWCCRPSPCR